jgi:hypothetical protein
MKFKELTKTEQREVIQDTISFMESMTPGESYKTNDLEVLAYVKSHEYERYKDVYGQHIRTIRAY